jgi:hypothetical protein
MSARHTLPFVCFTCRKSWKIAIEVNDDSDLTYGFRLPCPQCQSAMPFAGRYFKAPPQNALKQWAKVHLLWEKGWFTENRKFRGSPKSLCDAQTALIFSKRVEQIQQSRQRQSESQTKWRRASRRRRDF